MAPVNDQANLQSMLDIITPLSAVGHSEEDDQPIQLNQLEELEEVIHGQPYQPDQYSQANMTIAHTQTRQHETLASGSPLYPLSPAPSTRARTSLPR